MSTDEHPRRAQLVQRTLLTVTGTVLLAFETEGGDRLDAEPGQFIGVSTVVRGGGRAKTPYCLMSCDDDGGRFELLIRVVPEGPVSVALGTLRIGQPIAFRGPLGRQLLTPDPGMELHMMATGVGISPFLFFLDSLVQRRHPGTVRLYWGLRLDADLCLEHVLDSHAAALADFSWLATLSQPSTGWTGLRGRITESVPPLICAPIESAFMFCGNGAMSAEMMAALSTVGVTQRWMHDEPFFNRRHHVDPAVVQAIVSRFAPEIRRSAVPNDPADLFRLERPVREENG